MRIAIPIPDLSGGGAERTCLRIASGLIARGHEIDFLLFKPLIHYPDEVPSAARLFVLNTGSDDIILRDYVRSAGAVGWNPRALPNKRWMEEAHFIASYVSANEPDCILPSLERSTIATLWATALLPGFPPVIPTFHLVIRYENRKTRIRYRRLLSRSAHIVTVSDGVRDDLLTLTDVSPDRVSTIYNPALTPEMDELRKEVPDHPWMTDGGPPVVLTTGRLHGQKDHPTLLKAFHGLAKTRDLRLIILGKGERRRETEEYIRALNLEDKVSLPGWTDNPFAFMSRAALFVLSSKSEGLGNVLIEALACGCPVVSTDCPSGPSEILEGGRVGPLVPVGDHAALADAMGRVLDNPPDREMLMRRAAFFSDEKAISAYEELVAESVKRNSDASYTGTAAKVPMGSEI